MPSQDLELLKRSVRYRSSGSSGSRSFTGANVTLREVREAMLKRCWPCSRPKRSPSSSRRYPARSRDSGVHSGDARTSACLATVSVSRSCPTATMTRWVCFRCGSSSPASAARSGDLPSARHSGAAEFFSEGAKAVIDFSFGVVGVHRLEARSIASNARGNAALRKVGALQEGLSAPIVSAKRPATGSDHVVDREG